MWGKQIGRNKRTALLSAIIFTIAVLGVLCNGASRTVTVFHNNQCMVVSSYFTTPAAILQKAGILLNGQSYDMVESKEGLVMRIGPKYNLNVTVDGQTLTTESRADRVSNVLDRMGIVLGSHDRVTPSVDAILSANTQIVVDRIAYATVVREETVQPEVIFEDTDTLPVGAQSVKGPGVAGLAQVTYEECYLNGAVSQRTALSSVVLKQAQAEVRYRGTGDPAKFAPVVTTDAKLNTQVLSKLKPDQPIAVNAQGQPLQYKKCIKGLATAYTANPGALTAIGDVPQVGFIAVDPKVIPYGTMMFIKTVDGSYIYGMAKASDTGGFISGPVDVDLYFNTEAECIQFGVRNVEIYIL